MRANSRYSRAKFPALFSRPVAYFAGKLPALPGHITHNPHIANTGIERRTEKCKNPRAGDMHAPDFYIAAL